MRAAATSCRMWLGLKLKFLSSPATYTSFPTMIVTSTSWFNQKVPEETSSIHSWDILNECMYVCMLCCVVALKSYVIEVRVERSECCNKEERREVEAEGQKQYREVEPVPTRLQEKHLHIHTYIHSHSFQYMLSIK